MNIKKKVSSVLFISLLLVCAEIHLNADSGKKRFLFTTPPILFAGNYLSGLKSMLAAEQSRPMNSKPRVSLGKFALEILAGIGGNLSYGVGSMFLFGSIFPGENSDDWIPMSGVVGFLTGETFGSALGVYLVGNSGNVSGKFGYALLGSLAGEIVSLGIILAAASSNDSEYFLFGLLSSTILPPVCAAILFNTTLRNKSLPEGNGLFNLNKDKLTLGIPDIHIRPLPVHGGNIKNEIQFKINLLCVML